MSKGGVITLVVVAVVVIGGLLYWANQMSSPSPVVSNSASTTTSISNGSSSAASSGAVAGASTTGELFADSPDAPYAYLISGGSFDASTTKALTGFMVQTSTNADGSMQIMLKAVNPEYQTQTYAVEPGEKLYFVEKILGDDKGETDSFPNDDSAILVDSNGYIVQIGSPMPTPSGGKG